MSTADWSFILDRRTPGGEGTRYLAGSRMVRLGRWSCSCLLTLPSVLQSSPSLVEEGELDSVSTADWSLRLDRRTPSVAGLRPCTSSLKGSALSSASDRSNGQTDNKFLWIVLVRVPSKSRTMYTGRLGSFLTTTWGSDSHLSFSLDFPLGVLLATILYHRPSMSVHLLSGHKWPSASHGLFLPSGSQCGTPHAGSLPTA